MNQESFTVWMQQLASAWEMGDAQAAADLFSARVHYQENPFDPPLCEREAVRRYWQEMLAEQADVAVSFEVLAVTDGRAVVNWQALYTDVKTGEQVIVNGVSVGTFDGEGLCERWLEWWHKQYVPLENFAQVSGHKRSHSL